MSLPGDWVAVVRRASEGGAFADPPMKIVQHRTFGPISVAVEGWMEERIEALVGPPPAGFRFAWSYSRGVLRGRGAFARGPRYVLARLEPIKTPKEEP